jgi:hypothetical protein
MKFKNIHFKKIKKIKSQIRKIFRFERFKKKQQKITKKKEGKKPKIKKNITASAHSLGRVWGGCTAPTTS